MNNLVSKFDGSRILGPLTKQELELKVAMYLKIMQRVSHEEAEQFPLLIYQFNDGVFERINEIKFFSLLTS